MNERISRVQKMVARLVGGYCTPLGEMYKFKTPFFFSPPLPPREFLEVAKRFISISHFK